MTDNRYTAGQRIGQYEVTRTAPVPDLGIVCIFLTHGPTGAEHLHVVSPDDNNLFSVALRTPPADATGVAHILEHTVLCGSRRYPVRDPFFSMIKRSLSTFMNALTSDDWTMYPFSSRNPKDFRNLLDVYLDAVFFPNLRELDFAQEGHRLAYATPGDPTSPLVRTGVVYNEMKGAMSDPRSLLGHRLMKALFPTTTYGFNAGGDPEAIPDLSWEALRAFHADYYHPSNARFFTYGTGALEEHLAVIEDRVLARFSRKTVASEVTVEPPFASPATVEDSFPATASDDAERSMVQVAWRTAPITDSYEVLCLRLLAALLLGNPGAPLYRALLESGLGRQLAPGTGFSDDNRDTLVAAGLQGVRPDDAPKVEAVVLETLERLSREGFPPERVEAALHRLEFSIREIRGDHFPYPLLLLFHMIGPWTHGGDPVSPLLVAEPIARLRREAASGDLFRELIRTRLLDNPHRVTLMLHPDTGLAERRETREADALERLKGRLDEAGRRDIVERSLALKREQDTPPDLSCLPRLRLTDIQVREEIPTVRRESAGDRPVLCCPQQTNGIGYAALYFDASGLPEELAPWVPFFATALSNIGAAGADWSTMAQRLEAETGGVSGSVDVLTDRSDLDRCRGLVCLRGRALSRKIPALFAILEDLCRSPDFTDRDRLQTLVGQVATSLENAIPQSGHRYAAGRAASHLTASARLREFWSGLEYVRRMKALVAAGPEGLDALVGRFRELAARLFTADRLAAALVGGEDDLAALSDGLAGLAGRLPQSDAAAAVFDLTGIAGAGAAEGWEASVSVSYVSRVFRTVPFDHPDAAPLMVLSKLLRFGYLHREIREKGGAYGGMAAAPAGGGVLSMMSYRDPHLSRTARVFQDAADWAAGGAFDDADVEEVILGVFSDLDAVLSPEGRGLREFLYDLQGISKAMRQRQRDRVLAVKRGVLADAARRYLVENAGARAFSVIAAPDRLAREKTAMDPADRYDVFRL